MFDQTFDFSVHKLPEFKDHSLVTAQIYAPAAAQMKTTLRQVCEVPKLSKRTHNDNPLPSQLSPKFSEAIAHNDVDRAFQYWFLEFERVLLQVSQLQGHARPIKQAAKRGNITFHEQRAHPKTCRQQASTHWLGGNYGKRIAVQLKSLKPKTGLEGIELLITFGKSYLICLLSMLRSFPKLCKSRAMIR